MDAETTVAALREQVRRFVAERNWQRYHTPKDLSMAIAIEAAELMEEFQWMSAADSARAAAGMPLADPPPRRRPAPSAEAAVLAIADELADVLILCLALANAVDLDVSELVRRKLAVNEQNYPPSDR